MREKMIELIQSAVDGCATYWAGLIADYLLANGVTIQGWIPVTEGLPKQSGKYIVCSERKIKVGNWERMEKKVYQAKYYVYPTGCHWGQRDKGKHITHWVPMPEVPKGE